MDDRLASAISFSSADLAANREGRLTKDQKRLLADDFAATEGLGKKIVIGSWVAAILFLLLLIAIGFPQMARTGARRDPDTLRWTVLAFSICAGICAVIATLFVLMAKKGRRNLDDNLPVYSVSGVAQKSQYDLWYTLTIGDRDFVYSDDEEETYDAFEAGRSYNVYYIFNTSNIIVSAEQQSSPPYEGGAAAASADGVVLLSEPGAVATDQNS